MTHAPYPITPDIQPAPEASPISEAKAVDQNGLGTPDGARPFRFVAGGDLPMRPVSWLVRDYLEQHTVAVLYGAAGIGKTFLVLDLCCCVATNTPFHGLPVRHGAVFYIAGEGHQGIVRRLRAWTAHNGVSLKGAPIFISCGAAVLNHATAAARVASAISELASTTGQPPALIVIDTLSRNFRGDENSAADINQLIRMLDQQLRSRWEAAIVLVHHTGKDGERGARGSSALKGAIDAEYELQRRDAGRLITLKSHKMKDAPEPPSQSFELISVPILDDEGQSCTSAALQRCEPANEAASAAPTLGKNQQRLLAILVDHHREIAERLASQGHLNRAVLIPLKDWQTRCQNVGIATNRFREAKEALINRGLVRYESPHVLLAEPPPLNH